MSEIKIRSTSVPEGRLNFSDAVNRIEELPESQQKLLGRIAAVGNSKTKTHTAHPGADVDALVDAGMILESPGKSKKTVILRISEAFSGKNVHYYLHRKFDNMELYDDKTDEFISVPLLETDLPDDLATAELIKRGYYVRKS